MPRPVPFCWYELMTPDADSAVAFYGQLVGWTVSDKTSDAAMDYRMIQRSDGGMIGGMLQLDAGMLKGGAHPAWVPYLAVADLDSSLAAIEADGGKALMPRTDIAEGSFAMVTDPQGAPFYLMQPNPPEGLPEAQSDAFDADKAQHVRWNELTTSDPAGAKAFYAKHFGFEFNNVMPMGEAGDYEFMEFGGVTTGAIMPIMHPGGVPSWLVYFGVPSVEEASAAIEASDSNILMPMHEVPGGNWIVVATDPQGAPFGVVGPR